MAIVGIGSNVEQGFPNFAAIQLCVATFYLLVQAWIDFKPDLLEVSQLAEEIRRSATDLSRLSESKVSTVEIVRLVALCERFFALADDALKQLWKSPEEQKMLQEVRDGVNRIRAAAKAPAGAIAAALREAI